MVSVLKEVEEAPPLSVAERDRRYAQIRGVMRERGIDAERPFVVTSGIKVSAVSIRTPTLEERLYRG